jgi:hypothetical protein
MHSRKYNIKNVVKEGRFVMDWIQRAQDLAQMRVLVNRIMNMRVREHILHQLSIS